MLEDLEIGEAQAVEPERLARKTEELPPAIAKAWDETPVGEAKRLAVKVKDYFDIPKVGNTLLRLVTIRAKGQGYMAFKASYTPTDDGLSLYWQKKPGRTKKPGPAIQPMPSEPVTEKPKGRRISPATDELRDE